MRHRLFLISLCAAVIWAAGVAAQRGAPRGQWPTYGGDADSTKYSPLDEINRDQREDAAGRLALGVARQCHRHRRSAASCPRTPAAFKATPILVDGVLYIKTSLSQAVAIDAATGKTRWVFDPETWQRERPANTAYNARGVAYWSDGKSARIFLPTGDAQLWAIDAKTGRPIDSFGSNGAVDATLGMRRPVSANRVFN